MAAAANYAWVNRQSMTFLVRQAFAKQFSMSPDDLDMHLIYDVSHNIAKIEEHVSIRRIICVCVCLLLFPRVGQTLSFTLSGMGVCWCLLVIFSHARWSMDV